MKYWLEICDLCVCDMLRYGIDEVELLDDCGHSAASFPRQRKHATAFNMGVAESLQTIHNSYFSGKFEVLRIPGFGT